MSRIGAQTIKIDNTVSVSSWASVGGNKEYEGPLGEKIDYVCMDNKFDETTWEKSESHMQQEIFSRILNKSGKSKGGIDIMFAGDLLNQCAASHFAHREADTSFIGLYGACSTMAEGMALAAVFTDGANSKNSIALASSHFFSSERQFRFPLEYGGQRSQNAQWTVTGCGGVLISDENCGPFIKHVTFGKIVDMGINDVNNMGAAMAPAAVDTLSSFFGDTSSNPQQYDLILTGDLGVVGRDIMKTMMEERGYKMDNYNDCGCLIYDFEKQDIHSGGSGCACSALVMAADILPKIKDGTYEKVLFIGTGALMSPTSSNQGESIPSIAHLVEITKN